MLVVCLLAALLAWPAFGTDSGQIPTLQIPRNQIRAPAADTDQSG